MKNVFCAILASAVTLAGVSAVANQSEDYYAISAIEVVEIAEPLNDGKVGQGPIGVVDCSRGNFGTSSKNLLDPIDQVDMIVDKIINIGKKVWAVIEAGRPVVNYKTDVATALPEGARCWADLQQWSMPDTKLYGVSMYNGFGSEVVKFVYRVNYLAGGTADGVGKYIGYATTSPKDLYVAWGFNFNATASIPTVYNMGTRQDPLAGMQFTMHYTVKNVMNHIEQAQVYAIDGNGTFKQLD